MNARNILLFLGLSLMMICSGMINISTAVNSNQDLVNLPELGLNSIENGIDMDPIDYTMDTPYPDNIDYNNFLSDAENDYGIKWDPWLSKAAIHAVATTEDGEMMALAGGYLYDNEVHLYRWNYLNSEYDLVWEIGKGQFKSDVTSLAFADTDKNGLIELIAASEEGSLFVFEQVHIYDPNTNLENQFDLVWSARRMGRILDLLIADSDGDSKQEIIIGTADELRIFEYDEHGNYPFSTEHWMTFKEVFNQEMPSLITSVAMTDVNQNTLPEIAIGM
ncbi:MAG: hypothetical protein ACXAD7_25440 [Candidatus Kariarchaeaceae archaeon]|jgi:hypothetical protein